VSVDGGQEGYAGRVVPLAGFCAGREAVGRPVQPVDLLAVVGQLEAVLIRLVAYTEDTSQTVSTPFPLTVKI